MVFQHFRSLGDIFQAPVGAGTYHDLIDFDMMGFADRMGIFRQVRIRSNRNQFRQINLYDAFINCVRVCFHCCPRTSHPAFQESFRLFVHREDAVLTAGLNGHVADGETVGHIQFRYTGTGKLQALVTGAVYADHADEGQDQVFAFYIFGHFAGQFDFNSRGNLEPGSAAGHGAADIRLTHAGG